MLKYLRTIEDKDCRCNTVSAGYHVNKFQISHANAMRFFLNACVCMVCNYVRPNRVKHSNCLTAKFEERCQSKISVEPFV
jgi:hypothetical protein